MCRTTVDRIEVHTASTAAEAAKDSVTDVELSVRDGDAVGYRSCTGLFALYQNFDQLRDVEMFVSVFERLSQFGENVPFRAVFDVENDTL